MTSRPSSRRILILGSLPSSLRNFRGALLERLRTNGLEVHTAAPGIDGEMRSWLASRGIFGHDVRLSRTGLSPWQDLATLWDLHRLMRRLRPEIFMGYTIKPVVWGLLAARLAGVPERIALITGLGYAFTGRATGRRAVVQRVVRRLYRVALRHATLVFFQNRDDMAEFDRLGLLPPGVPQMVVPGSGVDLEHFAPVPLPKSPLRFLMIARLLGDKGVREYAEAARILRQDWPEARFDLVGELDTNPNSISLVEVRDWQDRGWIHWHGGLTDVRPALAASHVFVLPSYREGTPRTVLEAMATGRPVITTDAPGCRDTTEHGVTGMLVAVGDAKALSAAMRDFLEDEGRIPAMGQAALSRVRRIYDVHIVNSVMLEAMGIEDRQEGVEWG